MSRIIDLSRDIFDGMSVYPSDGPVRAFQDKFLERDGYVGFRLEIGMHSGTHIDTPMHLCDRDTFINSIPLERCMGRGCLLDVSEETVIRLRPEYAQKVQAADIVLLYTGCDKKYGTQAYYNNHPVVDESLADFLISKNIKMLGMDMPSPDKHPFVIHHKLFNADILILENLTNLSSLLTVEQFQVLALPIKIKAEAALARAAAIVDE